MQHLTQRQLTALVASIGKRTETLRSDYDTALRNAVIHIAQHGNVTQLNKLMETTTGKAGKRTTTTAAIAAWLSAYAKNIVFDTKLKAYRTNSKVNPTLLNDTEARGIFIETIEQAKPWFEFETEHNEKPASTFHIKAAIERAIKTAVTKYGKGDPVDLDEFRAMVAMLQAARFTLPEIPAAMLVDTADNDPDEVPFADVDVA